MGQAVSMTPYQKFKTIFEKVFRFTSTPVGLNILSPEFSLGFFTFFIIGLVSSVDLFSIYTMIAFDVEMFWKAATCLRYFVKFSLFVLNKIIIYFIENFYFLNDYIFFKCILFIFSLGSQVLFQF